MSESNKLPEKKMGNGRLSKKRMYEMTASKAARAIERLEELMNSTNENAALGAAKTILAKCLPDLKATDLTSDGDKIERIDLETLLIKAYGINTKPTKMPEDSD